MVKPTGDAIGRLTKATIVSTALDIVGNTTIQTKAEGWLDLILDEVARGYRFPELERRHQASIADGADTIAYPSDYGFLVKDRTSRAEGRFAPSDGSDSSLLYVGSLGETRDAVSHVASGKGTPTRVADDRYNSQWILHPIASPAGTVYLNYQSVPAVVATTAVVWFPIDTAMVDAIVFMAEQRRRGGQITLAAAVQQAAKRLALSAPSRATLWQGGSGSGLDPRIFLG